MRRGLGGTALLLALLAALFWVLTGPDRLPPNAVASAPGVAARGERIFWAGGCASCHAAKGATGAAALALGGGAPLATRFGTFQPPNISPDPEHGIGRWSLADFANAMQRGVDPQGRHLYPAFPYGSYARMTPGDIADLFAYLRTLSPVASDAPPDRVVFPFSIRRGIGLWKRVFLGAAGPVVGLPANAAATARAGQYLVEGPGHCGECHTPRAFGGVGGPDRSRWLAGAAALDGKGRVPNITPGGGMAKWTAAEIADYLKTGFTPDYDSVGGAMVEVQKNMARLTDTDRTAIAAYLKAVPAVPSAARAKP